MKNSAVRLHLLVLLFWTIVALPILLLTYGFGGWASFKLSFITGYTKQYGYNDVFVYWIANWLLLTFPVNYGIALVAKKLLGHDKER